MKMFKKFFNLPAKEKQYLFEAALFIYLAKLMLIFLPFRVCLKTLKKGNYNFQPGINNLKSFKRAIRRANKLAFWENVCLVQSFAGRWMLQRRNISSTLLIGVKHDNSKKIIAHAWLKVQDFEIVPRGEEYTTIASH